MSYKEKLLDPRWQKKRLEILDRDKWACQICGNEKETLHVHHRSYTAGKDPWDYHNDFLVTLCHFCHEGETEDMKVAIQNIVTALKLKFFSSSIEELAWGFGNMPMLHLQEVQAGVINYWINDEERLQFLIDEYFRHLKEKNKDRPDSPF